MAVGSGNSRPRSHRHTHREKAEIGVDKGFCLGAVFGAMRGGRGSGVSFRISLLLAGAGLVGICNRLWPEKHALNLAQPFTMCWIAGIEMLTNHLYETCPARGKFEGARQLLGVQGHAA